MQPSSRLLRHALDEDMTVMLTARNFGLLGALVLAGCATTGDRPPPPGPVAPAAAPAASRPVVAAEPPSAPVPGQVDASTARPAGSPEAERVPGRASPVPPPADLPPAPPAAVKVVPDGAKTAPAAAPSKARAAVAAKPPAKVASAPAAKEPPRKNGPAPAETGAKPAAPTLDLKALETRLRETDAIGVMTKLTLKSQVDDLLERFRAYHEGRVKMPLAELRQPYDSLILKVLALLQDKDPPLAGAIAASREAIWSVLTDGARFSKL